MEKSISELCENAKEYAEQGIFVFPIRPRGKKVIRYSEFRKPTIDKDVIEDLWKVFPSANIAAPTSIKTNAWVIIDVDIKFGVDGRTSMEQILKEYDLHLPVTSMVKSGTGGVHFYYKNNTGKKIDSSDGKTLGIDIRSEQAYAILPPSMHNKGNRYEWIHGNIQNIACVTQDVLRFVEIVNSLNRADVKSKEK